MMMSHLPPLTAAMIVVENGVLDLQREAEALGDARGDLHVRADRIALIVEIFQRRVGDVAAHLEMAGNDELITRDRRYDGN